MLHSSHHIRAFTLFCLFGAILSVIRVWITGTTDYLGFVWNLILALLPYFFAGFAVQKNGILRYIGFFLWFIFFPNSLYIWTDFVHLSEFPEMLHFDIVYISVMAIAGLICGFASLEITHTYWNEHYHKKIGWFLVSISLIFGIYGVYIGRFLRLNSWNVFNDPLSVVREVWIMTVSNGSKISIIDPNRLTEAVQYSSGATSLTTFIILYFSFFIILYGSVYHIRRAR